MNNYRKASIIVGVLFIIGTVAGSLSVVLTGSILSAPDYLTQVHANTAQVTMGAFFILLMAAALVVIPLVIFPIFKKYDERIALGYVIARSIECVWYIATAIILLMLVTLSQEFVKAGSANALYFQSLGDLLLAGYKWATLVGVYIVFNLGALLFYYQLYKLKLVPRFLSVWGFIAALMWLTGVILIMFGLAYESSMIYILSFVPMFAQEMVMAVWLIIKGFNSPSVK